MATEQEKITEGDKIWSIITDLIKDERFDSFDIIGIIEAIKLDLHFHMARDTVKKRKKAEDFEGREKKD